MALPAKAELHSALQSLDACGVAHPALVLAQLGKFAKAVAVTWKAIW